MKAAKEQNLTEQRKQRIHALISDTNLANTYISNLIGETKGIQHQRRLLKASLDMLEAITNSSDGTFPTSYSELLGRLVQFNASVDQLTTNEQVKIIKKRTAKKLFIACLDLNFWKDKSNIDWATMEKHLSLSTLDMSNIYVEQIRCLCPTDRFARGILTFLHSKKVPKNYARTYVQVLKKYTPYLRISQIQLFETGFKSSKVSLSHSHKNLQISIIVSKLLWSCSAI
ncbi:hypothetical protein WMQ67_03615 [Vibrio harveyi]|uniref:hypothetical protein n=1 Tax=Vibrio harveyi TaxID=669 RepID=UPI003750486F